MNAKADSFFSEATAWREEYRRLRTIVLGCGLAEELKWGHPCYTDEGRNVVLIHGFKEYCALLFFKGVLLKDPQGILIQQTKNVQAGRQVRFTGVRQIAQLEEVLQAYIREAIALERAGAEVKYKKTSEYEVPEEFERKLKDDPKLRAAFKALTPGRQRGYLFYFGGAKQSKTREARIEKHLKRILAGKGMED